MMRKPLRTALGCLLIAALLPLVGCSGSKTTEETGAEAPTPPVIEPGPETEPGSPAAETPPTPAAPSGDASTEAAPAVPATEPAGESTKTSTDTASEKPDDMPAEPTADATAPAATPVAEAAPSTTPTVPAVTLVEEVTAMPAVEMTEAQAATCVVKVGDTFPQISAATFSGEAKQLAELLGPRLTVVAFWNASNPYAVWELKRVGELIAMPLTDAGVSVVAINCGDPAELAQQTAAASPEKVVQLIDPQRAAFAQVATARLPRVYLLDASGKVLWFDLEYSQETERSLMQAVHFALQGSGG